jgi:hypothetical protein
MMMISTARIDVSSISNVQGFANALEALIAPLLRQPSCIEVWTRKGCMNDGQQIAGVRDLLEITGSTEDGDEWCNEDVKMWIVKYRVGCERAKQGRVLHTDDVHRAMRAAVESYLEDYDVTHEHDWEPSSV